MVNINSINNIAQTDKYQILINPLRNRVFVQIKGLWIKAESVPTYLSDWDLALEKLKPGFTAVIDLRNMILSPASIKEIHRQVQQKMASKGVRKIAELTPGNLFQTKDQKKNSNEIPVRRKFADIKEAERWLDQM